MEGNPTEEALNEIKLKFWPTYKVRVITVGIAYCYNIYNYIHNNHYVVIPKKK